MDQTHYLELRAIPQADITQSQVLSHLMQTLHQCLPAYAGRIGAAFAAALTEATRHQAQLAHHLSARLDAGATTAVATANTFIVTDHNAGGRIGTWW